MVEVSFIGGENHQPFNLYHITLWFMVFNATFNNISVISWRSVLLVEETRVPEKTTDLSQVTDKLSHNVVPSTPRLCRIRTRELVVMGTDCIHVGSFKSNYHTITTTMTPCSTVSSTPCHERDANSQC